MADSKISKKHHPQGTLAWRILTVAVFLLVIPLFFQSLFLYKQEYEEKIIDTKANLQVLAKERAHLIKELILMNWLLLNSSDVKQLYIKEIPLPSGVKEEFVWVDSRRDALLVGKKKTDQTAQVVLIPFSQITDQLGTSIPVRLALLDSKGKVLEENRKLRAKAHLLEVNEPIEETGLTLQLTVPMELIQGLHWNSYYLHFATLFLFVGGFGGVAVYLLTRRVAKPLNQLQQVMERVAKGAAHARYTSDWMGFEINQLGLQFNATLDGLLFHAQEAEKERLERGKLAEELRIGHDIQASLVPSQVPGFPGLDIATSYVAALEVNGDFYDLFRMEGGKLLLVICDSAGKGVSGCLYSLGLRSLIRAMASVIPSVAEIVRKTNDLFWMDAHESSMFSTLWLGIYDPKDHCLEYCSQGHPPALLVREGEIQQLWTQGIAMGAQKVDVIHTKQIHLKKGDRLILYTDGMIEAHNGSRQLFGTTRLEKFLLTKKNESSRQIADQLMEEIAQFSQGVSQHDDMTLIVLQVRDQDLRDV